MRWPKASVHYVDHSTQWKSFKRNDDPGQQPLSLRELQGFLIRWLECSWSPKWQYEHPYEQGNAEHDGNCVL